MYQAEDESGTARLAAAVAYALEPGLTIALDGPLGAGKTTFVRELASAAGGDPRQVASPTFVLAHQYDARLPMYHFDAYRIAELEEFLELGVDECFESAGVCLVEWASRVAAALPADRLQIEIDIVSPEARRFTVTALGERARRALTTVEKQLAAGRRRGPPS